MAQAQIASTITDLSALEAFFPAPAVSYQDAIRSIALESIGGEDPADRAAALARVFNLDYATVSIDIDEAISAMSDD